MTAEEFGVTQDELDEIRAWSSMCRRIRKFRNNSTLITFETIFGKDEAERLRKHYFELKFDFEEFMTYLTQPQINTLIAYIINNYKS